MTARAAAALVEMATDRTRRWWEEFRHSLPRTFLDLSEPEFHATAMQTVKVTGIPGIMRTEARARAVFGYHPPPLPSNDLLEARVAHRVRRRTVLDRARRYRTRCAKVEGTSLGATASRDVTHRSAKDL